MEPGGGFRVAVSDDDGGVRVYDDRTSKEVKCSSFFSSSSLFSFFFPGGEVALRLL